MTFLRPILRYHSHADPIWPDSTFKEVIYKNFDAECILCTGAKRPVLRDDENLKLHYLFAHSNHFFGKTLKVSSEIET